MKAKIDGANLYLSRREGQSITITVDGKRLKITYADFSRDEGIKLAFEGPREFKIDRTECITKFESP